MSKATAPRVFVPLTKVDEAQRLVYGMITQEILDKSGEVMDYDTSKPFFEKWSGDIHKASGGLSKGNLRVMHGLQVAGKLTDISFDDDNKAIEVCAKVVDDGEWEKVTEGCYTGFSVGGKYEKRWTEDGIKKYTAGPNEVSLVDNPCVGTATFSLVKADGATEDVMFKVTPSEPEPVPEVKMEVVPTNLPTNDQVVAKAEQMAKEANDGTTWMSHVEAARDVLMKSAPEPEKEDGPKEVVETPDDKEKTSKDEPEATDESATKVTPPGVKQVWTASDGTTFEKKADAEAHEGTLSKAEPTEAEKLKARLEKALNPPTEEERVELMADFDRLGKAINALSTPFGEDGKPLLNKGMYTLNRFSSILSDMAALSRSIKAEGNKNAEEDNTETAVSIDIIAAVKTLGASFISYATDQVQELLAGMDDEVMVTYYDYYYNAAKEEGETELAKDVCALISDHKDPSREKRESLQKFYGAEPENEEEQSDILTPSLQKRFTDLEADRDSFKKIAEEATTAVETLTKRVEKIEDTPLPRAPTNVIPQPGDELFFGKAVKNDAEKLAIVKEMIDNHGAEGMAMMMIKAAQQNGQRLQLKSQ